MSVRDPASKTKVDSYKGKHLVSASGLYLPTYGRADPHFKEKLKKKKAMTRIIVGTSCYLQGNLKEKPCPRARNISLELEIFISQRVG